MDWLTSLGDSAVSPANPLKNTNTVNPDGTVATGYAFGGPGVQQQLLENEGVAFINGKVDLHKYLYGFQY